MSRRTTPRKIVSSVLVVAAIGGIGAAAWVAKERLSVEETVEEVELEITSSVAEVRTLSVDHEAEGTLVYEPSIAVVAPAAGTVTRIVDAGVSLSAGDVIAVVDDVPIVWLDGDVPAWRTMSDGDVGDDVAQLEASLDALGYNADGDVTIDDEFTSATASMVEDWQEALGTAVTGRVELGTVVFGGGRSRVAGVSVAVGASVGADTELVSLGSFDRMASFELDPGDAVTLAVGDPVSVRLPDRSVVDAVVAHIEQAADTWTVTTTSGQVELPELDVVDVGLEWTRDVVTDELTIPSSALLRLDDGTYVVDVLHDDGTERRVVEVGTAVGTRVAVSSGLSAGDTVVTL